jgi:hypothetical protein
MTAFIHHLAALGHAHHTWTATLLSLIGSAALGWWWYGYLPGGRVDRWAAEERARRNSHGKG